MLGQNKVTRSLFHKILFTLKRPQFRLSLYETLPESCFFFFFFFFCVCFFDILVKLEYGSCQVKN